MAASAFPRPVGGSSPRLPATQGRPGGRGCRRGRSSGWRCCRGWTRPRRSCRCARGRTRRADRGGPAAAGRGRRTRPASCASPRAGRRSSRRCRRGRRGWAGRATRGRRSRRPCPERRLHLRLAHVGEQLSRRTRGKGALGAGSDGVDQGADPDQGGRGECGHGPAGTTGVEERCHAPIMARTRCESAENL